MNNITVDGSYFNNSFGLGGQPGDRTGVAPISLEAIEQVQVSVAPYDVRQGNFVGAGVNMVTRSGTNTLVGSDLHARTGTSRSSAPRPPGWPTIRARSRRRTPARSSAVRSSRTACSRSAASRSSPTCGRSRPSAPIRAASRRPGSIDARAGLGPDDAQRVPVVEVQVRHRPVREHPQEHARRNRSS